jgi:hypothetical protein
LGGKAVRHIELEKGRTAGGVPASNMFVTPDAFIDTAAGQVLGGYFCGMCKL